VDLAALALERKSPAHLHSHAFYNFPLICADFCTFREHIFKCARKYSAPLHASKKAGSAIFFFTPEYLTKIVVREKATFLTEAKCIIRLCMSSP